MDRSDDEDPPRTPARSSNVTYLPMRGRDGNREQRRAARLRWVFPEGAFSDPDLDWLGTAPAFSATGLRMDPNKDIKSVLQPIPVLGIDPNPYDVDGMAADRQYLVGSFTAPPGSALDEEVEREIDDFQTLLFSVADSLGRKVGPWKAEPWKAGRNIPAQAKRAAQPQYALDLARLPGGICSRFDFLVGRHETTGEVYHVWMHGFDFTHGNEQFFKPGDTARVRLRPLIRTDWFNPRRALRASTGWFGGGVNTLLWADCPEGDGATAFLVHLFPRGDCEDPKTIARAIGEAWHQYGAEFPAAVALLAQPRPTV